MSAADAAARILVVDDDPDLLALISMRLVSAGYTVTQAASGQEATTPAMACSPAGIARTSGA